MPQGQDEINLPDALPQAADAHTATAAVNPIADNEADTAATVHDAHAKQKNEGIDPTDTLALLAAAIATLSPTDQQRLAGILIRAGDNKNQKKENISGTKF